MPTDIEFAVMQVAKVPASDRNDRILAHYERLWHKFPERQSTGRLEHLRDLAIRDICGANGGKAEQRKEPRQ